MSPLGWIAIILLVIALILKKLLRFTSILKFFSVDVDSEKYHLTKIYYIQGILGIIVAAIVLFSLFFK